jgi:putative redox protein
VTDERERSDMAEPVSVTFEWRGDLSFASRAAGGHEIAVDADPASGTRPVESLLQGLGGCMAIDIVSILGKMRCPPESFSMRVVGHQKASPPRFFRRVLLEIVLTGDVPREKVDRAVELSRKTYCSVLHTLRPDLELVVDVTIEPAGS